MKHIAEFRMRSDIYDLFWKEMSVLVVEMATGNILKASPSAEALFCCATEGTLVGRNVDDLVPANLRHVHALHRRAYSEAPQMRPMGLVGPVEGVTLDGATLRLEIQLIPSTINGVLCVLAVIADMTHRAMGSDAPPPHVDAIEKSAKP